MEPEDRIKEMHSQPDYLALAAASRRSDDLAEAKPGLPQYVMEDLGIDWAPFDQWAEQRALRCVLIATGDLAKLEPLRRGEIVAMNLTDEQRALLPMATIAAMDGFSIGATFERARHEEVTAEPVSGLTGQELHALVVEAWEEEDSHSPTWEELDEDEQRVACRMAARLHRVGA